MSSFYGGKQGRTYHIVARYDCVDLNNYAGKNDFETFNIGTSYTEAKGKKFVYENEYYVVLVDTISGINDLRNEEKTYHVRGMVQQFAKGGAYTEANYGEYVLIDTIFNLNHKSDLENGLLYRRGFDYNEDPNLNPKPNINDNTYYDEQGKLIKDLWQAAWDAWVQKPGAGAIYVGQIVGPQGESPELTPIKWEELESKVGIKKIVIPSSITKGNNSTLITDSDGNQIWKGDAIKVGSYTVRDSDNNVTGAEIAFDIPQTVLEATVNLNKEGEEDVVTYTGQVIEDSESENHPFYYKWNFYVPQVTDFGLETGLETNSEKDGQGKNIVNNDEYITYKVHNANGKGNIVEHLGRWPYRVINKIEALDNDRIFINWTEGTIAKVGDLYNFNKESSNGNQIYAVCIETLTNSMSGNPGQINVEQIPAIRFDGSTNDYDLGLQSSSGNSRWRVIELPETGPIKQIQIDYKAGLSDTINITNIDYFVIDSADDLYIKYSNRSDLYYICNMNRLQSIQLENQRDITDRQKFVATYKNGTRNQISDPLNTILAIDMLGDNIIALYSDPVYRQEFSENENNYEHIDWFLKDWTDPVTGTFYKNLVWINLTSSKGSYHVQGEYTYDDLEGNENANIDLSRGFDAVQGLEDRVGWLVTVQDGDSKKIFAFDYNNGEHTIGPDGSQFQSHWYEIFSLTISEIDPVAFIAISNSQPNLNNNGLWFVTHSGHDAI